MNEHLIAIIDDQADIRHAACLLLESRGYTAKAYASGEEFLNDVNSSQRQPDCILTDLMVSDADGNTILETLRAFAPTPIVVLTGNPHALPRRAVDDHIYAILRKPASPEVIIRSIESALAAG